MSLNGLRVTAVVGLATSLATAGCTSSAAAQEPTEPVRATVECRITRIVDGDTVHCDGLGSVRLIGIDSPERSQPPFAGQATAALRRMIPVGTVTQLERDVEARDRYGRVLGYLWFDGALVNWRMVNDGYAVSLTYPPNVQYTDAFSAAQESAREARRGLWADDGFTCVPREHRRGRC